MEHFILLVCSYLVYNVIATVRNGSKVQDELAEAPALERVTKKRTSSEGWHTWLERRPIQLTLLATVAILNWWYCSDCTNYYGKI